MKAGEIWVNKKREDITLKILEFKGHDYWRVIYFNTYADDGTSFDNLKGSVIFNHFIKLNN